MTQRSTGPVGTDPADRVAVDVLAVVFAVTDDGMSVLLWRRGLEPDSGRYALPGGPLPVGEDVATAMRRQLAEKVDLRDVAHLEQLSVFGDPARVPGPRTIAISHLGLVPTDRWARAGLPADTAWHRVDALPDMAFDHRDIVLAARTRLAGKLSYTNIGFALAPEEFPVSELRAVYCATLGYQVDATNLLRVLSRRGVIAATGRVGVPGRSGGRPPALYRFVDRRLRVTDEFAALRPPS